MAKSSAVRAERTSSGATIDARTGPRPLTWLDPNLDPAVVDVRAQVRRRPRLRVDEIGEVGRRLAAA